MFPAPEHFRKAAPLSNHNHGIKEPPGHAAPGPKVPPATETSPKSVFVKAFPYNAVLTEAVKTY